LKFAKSWLGFSEVKFFGYLCKNGSYEMTAERKLAIQNFQFPSSQKGMQSFLGAALFFKGFVPNYSQLTAPLNDMCANKFDWNPSSWSSNYLDIFEQFKSSLQTACAVFYPDYALEWILRTDASLTGVGAVLFQIFIDPNGVVIHQPLGFASQKFSSAATRWPTIEQEAYGIYFAVKTFAYYLHCKNFTIETDHNNLIWMEASIVPKIIRWRIYLQSFTFLLRHIPGTANTVADWQSRMLLLLQDDTLISTLEEEEEKGRVDSCSNLFGLIEMDNVSKVLSSIHGGRALHPGIRRTWLLLNKLYAGHGISL
jgi:hypothetical protein